MKTKQGEVAPSGEQPKFTPGTSREYRLCFEGGRGVEFDADRNNPAHWLGPVVGACEIAEYGFVEYRQLDFHNGPNYGKETGRTAFSVYINGYGIGRSAGSMDEAMVIAIAYKRDGCNSQAARFF